jgi:predicted acetyltransferase
MSISFRTGTEAGTAVVQRLDDLAFGTTTAPELARFGVEHLELDRTLVADLDGSPAGQAACYSMHVTVPGGDVVPMAGVSWVGVLPTSRRRGVLTALMTRLTADVHERGTEALAGLWASEQAIYGRFGFGWATSKLRLEIPVGGAAGPLRVPFTAAELPPVAFVDAAGARTAVESVWARMLPRRAGHLRRTPADWDRTLADPGRRPGDCDLRCLVAGPPDAPLGYALFTTVTGFMEGVTGSMRVVECVGLDAPASAALWQTLLGHDLIRTVHVRNLPVDDPLVHWLSDVRAASPRLGDALHVRLVDVGRALEQRAWSAPVDVVLDVTDRFAPWNARRWRLSADPADGRGLPASCSPTSDPADLALDVSALGAAYLGGTPLAGLGAAGYVTEHTPGALAATDAAMRLPTQPWCPFVF